MKRMLPDTLQARAILILTLVFIVSHTLSLMIYKANRDQSVLLIEESWVLLIWRISFPPTSARKF